MPAASLPFATLRTKLRPPRLSGDVLMRARLLALLDRTAALTLVIAPAGYGKTTLVSTWLKRCPWRGLWLSLDDADNTLAVFLVDLVSALREAFPSFGQELLALVHSPAELTAEAATPLLANAFDDLPSDVALVLDDYYRITSPAVHQVVFGLLLHPPRTLHLVITSRFDPPVPARIRLHGAVTEIRAADLAFVETETAQFLQQAAGQAIDAETAARLTAQSEGWAASLRLARVLAEQRTDLPLASAIAGSRPLLLAYLDTEVVARLPASTQRFLERTSILDHLHGPLCDAVNGSDATIDGNALLRSLEDAGVFLTALDEDRQWFRYHALFRTLLQQRLMRRAPAEDIGALHRAAAVWYEDAAMLEDALKHLLAAEDIRGALALFARHRPAVMLAQDFRRLETWIQLFPVAVADDATELLLAQAWICQHRYNHPALEFYRDRAANVMEHEPADPVLRETWSSELAALRAPQAFRNADSEGTLREAALALSTAPAPNWWVQHFAALYLATGLQMTGRPAAVRGALDGYMERTHWPLDLREVGLHHISGFVHSAEGDLEALRLGATALVGIARAKGMANSEAWGNYFLGAASYKQNELATAIRHFRLLCSQPYRMPALAYAYAAFSLALCEQTLGATEAAQTGLSAACEHIARFGGRELLDTVEACRAELALRRGDVDAAVRWRRHGGMRWPHLTVPLAYNPSLTAARVLLAEGGASQLAAAERLLAELLAFYQRIRSCSFVLEVLTTQAVLYCRQGDEQSAQQSLTQAVELAAPHNHLRVLVDQLPDLEPLLAAYRGAPALALFVARVRSSQVQAQPLDRPAFAPAAASSGTVNGGTVNGSTVNGARMQAGVSPELPQRNVYELLTFREVDVLQLLLLRQSNKEIATELGVSVETVKQHTSNLYRKLKVKNRRQAILAAGALGLAGDPAPSRPG